MRNIVYLLALGLSVLLANPAAAQLIRDVPFPTVLHELTTDVTGDGIADRLRVFPLNETYDALSIEIGIGRMADDYQVPRLFSVPTNLSDWPSLDARNDESFLLHWGCLACGSTHSHRTFTTIWREGRFVVGGFSESITHRWTATGFDCEVNLFTGRGSASFEAGYRIHSIRRENSQAIPLTEIGGGHLVRDELRCETPEEWGDDDFREEYLRQRDGG